MRRSTIAAAACALIAAVACEGTPAITYPSAPPLAPSASWTFDNDRPGGLPSGTERYSGSWTVRAVSGAPSPPNALCQVGDAEFPAIALSSAAYADVTVTLRFKPISGRVDQAAGILFRAQDKDNYYILRANALETNVNFYKYAGGRRSMMKEGGVKVASGQWQELRLEVVGDRMRGYLNGQLVVETADATYKAGRVGLWTKADSLTCFDDVTVTPKGAGALGDATTTVSPGVAIALVELAEHFFSPALMRVKVGTTLTWRNVGQQTHDVNAEDGSFRSGNLEPGNTFSVTFTTPGRFKYYCIPHAGDGMTGEVVVE